MESIGAFTRYSDTFHLNNKNQVLQLKISGEDRYLIKDEVPIGVVWRGDNESSVFYAFLANLDSGIMQIGELEKMNQKLHDKIAQSDSLKQVISPLLDIVENGWYQIFYHEPLPITLNFSQDLERPKYLGANYFNFCQDYNSDNKRSSIWVEDTVIFTQDSRKLNSKRVEFYKKSISEGKRPTIITMAIANLGNMNINAFQESLSEDRRAEYAMENSSHCIEPQFIIDGHHKAKAYIELNEKASIISLVKLQFKEGYENFLNIEDRYKMKFENQIGEKIK